MWPRHITERSVLRVLISGFALALLLLGAAGFVAVRGTREIESDAEELVREELAIARLLNEVQAEEVTMTAVLHHLVRTTHTAPDPVLVRELLEADRAITRAAKAAEGTKEGPQWRALDSVARDFSASALRALQKGDRSEATITHLFALHDSVVAGVKELVVTSTSRAAKVDEILASRTRELSSESFGLLGSCFFLALVCAVLTVRMAANSIRHMEWQASELNQVSWQMIRGQEDAARRFSHELHDELGQSLAAIKANLTGMRPEDYSARCNDCMSLVDDAIANVRELSQLLRPVMLDDFGLDAALRWLSEKFAQRTGIHVDYKSDLRGRLADDTETHLFRIAQEALTNVARHSHASQVRISVESSVGSNDATVRLNITDNGRGLAVPEVRPSPSMGLVGMRVRARQAGGELNVATPAGGGLSLQVCVPAIYTNDDADQKNTNPVSR